MQAKPDNTQFGPACWEAYSLLNSWRGSELRALNMCSAFKLSNPTSRKIS